MKKSLLLIITVALLGVLTATFWSSHKNSPTKSSVATTTTNQPASASVANTNSSTPAATTSSAYHDGNYSASGRNRYETLSLSVTIAGGHLTDVTANANPYDSQSQMFIDYGLPNLKQQALSAQSANIDGVSGATMLSQTYQNLLQSALSQAQNG